MAYFNHAFRKTFLGTQLTNAIVPTPVGGQPGTINPNPNLKDGFIITSGILSAELANTTGAAGDIYGPGSYGFFNPNGNVSVTAEDLSSLGCCPLYLASASLMTNDKIGPFHGGYKESNKSKIINPRYVQNVYRVDSCTPQQAVVHVGATNFTCPVVEGGPSCNDAACCKEFLCGETYYLRIDVKGSPALRFANHQLYQTLQADGGCCAGPTPTVVDPTLIFLQWGRAVSTNPYLSQMIKPIVYDYTGTPWFATAADAVFYGWPATQIFDNYAGSVQAAAWTDAAPGCAGMTLIGAYVETKFGNCSFQITDFFEKEPVKILVSEVDYNGDPCVFTGLCVQTECPGLQGMGFGEQVLRDLILSESYLQNYFHTDIRIREITQGNDILNAVNRNALYVRYFILHSVPRFNNPTGVFDNDRYLLEIVTSTINSTLDDFLTEWIGNCSDCVINLDTYAACVPCEITPVPEPAPVL
jgi:hypothetical protein